MEDNITITFSIIVRDQRVTFQELEHLNNFLRNQLCLALVSWEKTIFKSATLEVLNKELNLDAEKLVDVTITE